MQCEFRSVSHSDKDFGNCEKVCPICPELFPICVQLTHNWLQKHKFKVMIRNQKMKGTFILGPLFSKWMGVFQYLLDCFQSEAEHLFKIHTSPSSVVFVC